MQTYPEVHNKVILPSSRAVPCSAAKDITNALALSALASALAFQTAKFLGFACGMDEHVRLVLSYLGLAMCLVAAPTFLIFGGKMTMKSGFLSAGVFIFSVVLIASFV